MDIDELSDGRAYVAHGHHCVVLDASTMYTAKRSENDTQPCDRRLPLVPVATRYAAMRPVEIGVLVLFVIPGEDIEALREGAVELARERGLTALRDHLRTKATYPHAISVDLLDPERLTGLWADSEYADPQRVTAMIGKAAMREVSMSRLAAVQDRIDHLFGADAIRVHAYGQSRGPDTTRVTLSLAELEQIVRRMV